MYIYGWFATYTNHSEFHQLTTRGYTGLPEFFRLYNEPNERRFEKKTNAFTLLRVLAAIHEKGATLTNHLAGAAGEGWNTQLFVSSSFVQYIQI